MIRYSSIEKLRPVFKQGMYQSFQSTFPTSAKPSPSTPTFQKPLFSAHAQIYIPLCLGPASPNRSRDQENSASHADYIPYSVLTILGLGAVGVAGKDSEYLLILEKDSNCSHQQGPLLLCQINTNLSPPVSPSGSSSSAQAQNQAISPLTTTSHPPPSKKPPIHHQIPNPSLTNQPPSANAQIRHFPSHPSHSTLHHHHQSNPTSSHSPFQIHDNNYVRTNTRISSIIKEYIYSRVRTHTTRSINA